MDHYSILDHSSSSPAMEGDMSGTAARVSARNTNTPLPRSSETEPRFPGEDAGRSLAEMAQRDLEATLQLLADRAHYITGASGAAIALRRGEHNDMLCRANAGSNAPELGALLSMEYGLSGECVRTRQILRCDDAERDPRVNRDVCRELGIASVVVMPILSGEQVLGVFELLSGKPRAFDERDLSALLRLSEMVETAVKHAVAAQIVPTVPKTSVAEIQPEVVAIATKTPQPESSTVAMNSTSAPVPPSQEVAPPKQDEALPVPKKALFWSAAMRAQASGQSSEDAATIAVPPVLRNLQKCQACGFPVSQGRAFCVECEEKQWRGQRLPLPAVSSQKDQASAPQTDSKEPALRGYARGTFIQDSLSDQNSPRTAEPKIAEPAITEPQAAPLTVSAPASAISPAQDSMSPSTESADAEAPVASPTSTSSSTDVPSDVLATDNSAPFLSSALQSESWFASNKYILGALLLVAIIIAAIALLH
jgi:hypothetical protein